MVKYGTVSYFTKHVQIAEYDLMISDAGFPKLLSGQAWRAQAVEAVITKLILLKRELLPQGSPPASL